jgi:hypothetical protein
MTKQTITKRVLVGKPEGRRPGRKNLNNFKVHIREIR